MLNKDEEHKKIILEFRKKFNLANTCGYNKTKLYKQMILSPDIAMKLLKDPIDKIIMRNSTKGKIQDFCKWVTTHITKVESEGKSLLQEEIDEEYYKQFPDERPNPMVENALKNPSSSPILEEPITTHQALTKGNDDMPESLKDKTVGDRLTTKELEFFRKLGEAHKMKPNNCVITVNLY